MPIKIPLLNEKPEKADENPAILCLYGLPKVGKTTDGLAKLDKCLILDIDIPHGTRHIDFSNLNSNAIRLNNIQEFSEALQELKNLTDKKQNPYKYIAIDSITQLEKWSIIKATEVWRRSPVYSHAKQSKYQTVIELPDGAGYYWLRKVFFSYIDYLTEFCDRVILIGHVNLADINKETKNVDASELALLGKSKLGITSMADATGYLYRNESDEKLMITFKAIGNNSSGARFEHLRGQKFGFSWDKIYPELRKEVNL
jgi:hypothetical protein